jgi:hypothetical protein
LAQSTFCWLLATKAIVPSTPTFKPSCRRLCPRSSSPLKHLASSLKVFGSSFFGKKYGNSFARPASASSMPWRASSPWISRRESSSRRTSFSGSSSS